MFNRKTAQPTMSQLHQYAIDLLSTKANQMSALADKLYQSSDSLTVEMIDARCDADYLNRLYVEVALMSTREFAEFQYQYAAYFNSLHAEISVQ